MKKYFSFIVSLWLCLPCLMLCTGCFSTHRLVPINDPAPLPEFCVPEKIRVALVLGSGGVRGMAHVGVLEELEAAGIPIDLIVGCSAGSIVGAIYADNPHAETTKQAVWKLRTQNLMDFDLWNCRYGLSQGRSMYRVLDQHLDAETFEELKIPLVIVATDLNSGEVVPMGSGDLMKAVQASCSIPLVFVPCEHQGRILVDGGVANPVPVKLARDLGAQIIIAVDLCELLPHTFPTNLFEVATRSAEITFMWQNETCTRSSDVIIRPKTCGVGAFNENMKWQIYQAGKNAAKEQIPRIQELVAKLATEKCLEVRTIKPICYKPAIESEEARRLALLSPDEVILVDEEEMFSEDYPE